MTRARLAPGLALAALLGAVATALTQLAPVVGAPVIAILLGLLTRMTLDPGARFTPGIASASRTVLQAGIVLLGFGLGLGTVVRVGAHSLPVMLGTLAAALAAGRLIGRRLGVGTPLRTLVTVGTAICGASAIAAVATVVEVEAAELAYAISTIFVFNIAAVLVFPVVGHLLGLGQQAFGLWAGTAVNDTSSVVAAGYAYGHAAGAHAVVVKLTRTTLIIPIVLALAALKRTEKPRASTRILRARAAVLLVPPFLVLFLVAAAVNSAGLVGTGTRTDANHVALYLIAVALAAIGLSTRPRALARTGRAPLVLGGILWAIVAVTSLLLQAATGRL
jgi:uncharacterized integral membrane protein (TIGR00698 family)